MKAIGAVSGLEYLEGLLKSKSVLPIGALMDFEPIAFEHGKAVFEGTPAEFHYNPIGTVHGGFAATLLDSALGCAVHTYTTVELNINYVRPLRSNTGRVTCEGAVIHSGSRIATAEARLKDASGKLYAHGTNMPDISRMKEPA
jgi:uncharacterized protein (TIGR00369 family)